MATVTVEDSLAVANRLRPVLVHLNRHLRREVHKLGVSAGQVALLLRGAVTGTGFDTDPHPYRSGGWRIEWGTQVEPRPVRRRIEPGPDTTAFLSSTSSASTSVSFSSSFFAQVSSAPRWRWRMASALA